MTDCRFSFAPFGEPGRVKMSELFRTPATGRDMTANGVTASEAASIPWTSPGACLWMRGTTAYSLSTYRTYEYIHYRNFKCNRNITAAIVSLPQA